MLVQQSATFLLDSHKKMKVWLDLTKQTHKTIKVIINSENWA